MQKILNKAKLPFINDNTNQQCLSSNYLIGISIKLRRDKP